MNLQIVPFSLEHYDAVFALWQQSEGVGLSESDSRQGIAAYLGRNPGLSYVAIESGAVIGAVICGHDGRRGYLSHLAVRVDRRRRSIGRRLVEKCLDSLRKAGIPKCHLFVYGNNLSGLEFWKSLGWTPRDDLTLVSKMTSAVK